jgi:hypothetical protein
MTQKQAAELIQEWIDQGLSLEAQFEALQKIVGDMVGGDVHRLARGGYCSKCEGQTRKLSDFAYECAACEIIFHTSDAALKRFIDEARELNQADQIAKGQKEAMRRMTFRAIVLCPLSFQPSLNASILP